jgi:hypothetical protein
VPRIASFDGLIVKLYFNDHPPPHVHVYAGRVGHPGVQMARISIDFRRAHRWPTRFSKGCHRTQLVRATPRCTAL